MHLPKPVGQASQEHRSHHTRAPTVRVVWIAWMQRRRAVNRKMLPPGSESAGLDVIFAIGAMGTYQNPAFIDLEQVIDYALHHRAHVRVVRVLQACS